MKVNLIIDGNNFLYKSFDVSKYASRLGVHVPETEKKLGSPEALELFKKKVDYDIKQLLNNFGKVDNIFIVQDAGSWRKKVLIDGKTTYKENRVKGSIEIDWDNVKEGLDYIFEQNPKYIPIKIRHLEGDDVVYLIVKQLEEASSKNINIIVSTDGDFQQLVSRQTIIFNFMWQKNRFIVSNDFDLNYVKNLEASRPVSIVENFNDDNLLSMFDVSSVDTSNEIIIESLAEKIELFNMERVDSQINLLSKILCGDDKDDVPSSYTWDGPSRKIRVTDKYSSKVLSLLEKDNINLDLDSFLKNIDIVHSHLKIATKQDIPKDKFIQNILVNKKLLHLSSEEIPENLQEDFNLVWKELKEKYGTF